MKAIIVFYDSLNKDYLPTYNENCDTIAPNFKRLAEKACTFDNSYVGSMPCIPARRELHTGRYNFLHKEWGPLEPFDDSMPEILKKSGTYTHLISDHLHYWEDGGANYHTRYNTWECVRGQEGDHWKGHVDRPDIPKTASVPQSHQGGGESSLWKHDWVNREYIKNENDFPQEQCFDRAVDFINQNKNSDNWLLHLETFDPHEPFYAPKKYLDMYPTSYEGDHFDWPRGKVIEKPDEVEHCIRQYKALVTMCDYNLGKILDIMDENNMWEDTMLIVGTDHGFLLDNHGYWGKNLMPYYNEIANNPLFVWDPREKVAGEHRNSLVQMIDWAPTVLDFFKQDIPKDMQGKSMRNVIKNDEKIRDHALFGVFSGQVNITDGNHIYMRGAVPERKDEVYNYTLMPQHMTKRFSVSEMKTAVLHEGFEFTKGSPVLKIKSKEKYPINHFGTLLFDIKKDSKQLAPIKNEEIEEKMISALIGKMKENHAPSEQYFRLGLENHKDL